MLIPTPVFDAFVPFSVHINTEFVFCSVDSNLCMHLVVCLQEEQLDAILSTAVETSSLGLITGCIKQWTAEGEKLLAE